VPCVWMLSVVPPLHSLLLMVLCLFKHKEMLSFVINDLINVDGNTILTTVVVFTYNEIVPLLACHEILLCVVTGNACYYSVQDICLPIFYLKI
jgi:hypothetical protein